MTTQTKHCANPNHPLEAHVPTAECGHEATTQTKPAWTPGPWVPSPWSIHRLLSGRFNGCFTITGALNVAGESKTQLICRTYKTINPTIDKAHARLISKAPEMAELLREIAETLDKLAPCPEQVLDDIAAKAERLLADLEAV